jgi:hypothetical protein
VDDLTQAEKPAVRPIPPAALLSDDSPLRALPTQLDRRQVVVLNGIGTSIDMTEVAYRQLQAVLREHNRVDGQGPGRPATIHALTTAWTIIDTANRLRTLVGHLPGLKHGPAVESLMMTLKQVVPLRNAIQHLDGEIDRLPADGRPIWGSISWANFESPEAKRGQVGLLVPSTLGPDFTTPLVNPVGRTFEIPIGLVELTAAGSTVSLSDVADAVRRFGGRLERAAAAALPSDKIGVLATFDLPID